MNLIETKPVGDANFYKFSVDFTGDDFILAAKLCRWESLPKIY